MGETTQHDDYGLEEFAVKQGGMGNLGCQAHAFTAEIVVFYYGRYYHGT